MRLDWWGRSSFNSFVGEKVVGVSIFDDTAIKFDLINNKKKIAIAHGDCCSESWLFSIAGIQNLIGQVIIGIVPIDSSWVDPDDGLGTQEVDEVDALGLVTLAGITEIIVRNSSNGYYGNCWSIYDRDNTYEWFQLNEDYLYPRAIPLYSLENKSKL